MLNLVMRTWFFEILFAVATVFTLAAQDAVSVFAIEDDDGSVQLYARNDLAVEAYVSITLPQLVNMTASTELPFGGSVAPGAEQQYLFELNPVPGSRSVGYSLAYTYAKGNPVTAHHDDDYLYLLPFAHGAKYRLSQGFHGTFTHYGENEYAVDFEMDVGTGVYAARGGLVAEVEESYSAGGPGLSYTDSANFIMIQHDDGSFGNYAHLMRGGAIVEPGDRVVAGQLIGYSGNTGRSSGPHLHFDVRMPQMDGTMQSIPFSFYGEDGARVEPTEGAFYYSYHPGGAPFDAVLGRDLTTRDYDDYLAPYTGDEGIEVRVEQVDLTFVVFVQNGYGDSRDVELRFSLQGLTSDLGTAVTVSVPGRSEVFATILRPIPGATRIQYAYSVRYYQ